MSHNVSSATHLIHPSCLG